MSTSKYKHILVLTVKYIQTADSYSLLPTPTIFFFLLSSHLFEYSFLHILILINVLILSFNFKEVIEMVATFFFWLIVDLQCCVRATYFFFNIFIEV